ncbi:MAG: hypothetical protein PHE83_02020 [Opitutaceae bacterium]|nr:hypothetical protein [Opitutaceae bacterium]
MLHLHIGLDIYGAGNIGDDWMLAGFLGELARTGARARLTCCIPRAAAPMQQRFPQVEWHPADPMVRRQLISEADVWLGLGDTPFQCCVGPYLLDHIVADLTDAEAAAVPAYFLGVGVDEAEAMAMPQTRFILERAAGIWTRDPLSAELLQQTRAQARIFPAADLAHAYFQDQPAPAAIEHLDGLVLHVEKSAQLSRDALSQFLLSQPAGRRLLWIAQEVRPLAVSEMLLWQEFSVAEHAALRLCLPDYAQGKLAAFIQPYDRLRACLTTRYHSALAAAWRGAAVSVFARSLKLKGLLQQIPLHRVQDLAIAASFSGALELAQPAPLAALHRLAADARAACHAFFDECGIRRPTAEP